MPSLKKMAALCAAPVLAAAMAFPALPQEPAVQGPTIKTQVNLVNLFVTVRDKSKRIVTDLKQDDFKVSEDGQDQKIAFFSKEVTLPITIGLLMDTSGSEQYMLGAIQDGASNFLNRVMRKGDEAMVMSFDLDVDLLADFTDDRSQLNRAIHKAQINTGGGGITPGTLPVRRCQGHQFLRCSLSGLQRKALDRSRPQSYRGPNRRRRQWQQSPRRGSHRSRPAHRYRRPHPSRL